MARISEKNTIKPTKGDLRGHRWIIFDAVTQCQAEDCPLFDICPYEKTGKCSVESKYTSAIFETITDDIGDKLTQRLLNKISLHLVPLYGMLVKMKKVALSIESPTYETAQGAKKIHPIFREIREIIGAIEKTQRSMGIDGEYVAAKAIYLPGNGGAEGSQWEEVPTHGDDDYMAELFKVDSQVVSKELFPEGTDPHTKRSVRK